MLELMRLQPVEWNDPHNRVAKKEMATTLHKYFEVLRRLGNQVPACLVYHTVQLDLHLPETEQSRRTAAGEAWRKFKAEMDQELEGLDKPWLKNKLVEYKKVMDDLRGSVMPPVNALRHLGSRPLTAGQLLPVTHPEQLPGEHTDRVVMYPIMPRPRAKRSGLFLTQAPSTRQDLRSKRDASPKPMRTSLRGHNGRNKTVKLSQDGKATLDSGSRFTFDNGLATQGVGHGGERAEHFAISNANNVPDYSVDASSERGPAPPVDYFQQPPRQEADCNARQRQPRLEDADSGGYRVTRSTVARAQRGGRGRRLG
jgi:hypothetical protein